MTRRKKISIGAIVLLLLLLGACWWVFGHESAQLRKVRMMVKDIPLPAGSGIGPISSAQRTKFEALRKEIDKLNPVDKAKLFGSFRKEMEKRMVSEVNNYFAMSKEQRAAYMDQRIKEMEQFRKDGDSNRDRNGPGGPGGPGGSGGPPPRGKPSYSQMRSFHTQMLSRVPPVVRAQMSAMHADMRQQRIAAGLPADPQPPRPPR